MQLQITYILCCTSSRFLLHVYNFILAVTQFTSFKSRCFSLDLSDCVTVRDAGIVWSSDCVILWSFRIQGIPAAVTKMTFMSILVWTPLSPPNCVMETTRLMRQPTRIQGGHLCIQERHNWGDLVVKASHGEWSTLLENLNNNCLICECQLLGNAL